MEFIAGTKARPLPAWVDIGGGNRNNRTATLHGVVHRRRDMGGLCFLTLRTGLGLLQCVCPHGVDLDGAGEECAVEVSGLLRAEGRAPGGYELEAASLRVLSRPAVPLPVSVSRPKLDVRPDTELDLRPVTLRNLRARAVFHIQAGLGRAFREYLQGLDFTEIHTPKLVSSGTEGGANLFRLDYFGQKAFLAQSPQFYKQAMVAVFERVFEVAPVFRAEKHATQRHLNEYTCLDLEIGFLHSFRDLMELEAGFLQYAFSLLVRDYAPDLDRLGISLPNADHIPVLRFDQAKRLAAQAYGRPSRDPCDLEPEEEANISRYVQETWGSDFVFLTHYPSKKRPFYAMDDPEDPRYTLSFDLLFRGQEITTGGQRIHDYAGQVAKLAARGLEPEDYRHYLMIHKYGIPPHGGLGIGLERLTARLCGLESVKSACLFPRDRHRLTP